MLESVILDQVCSLSIRLCRRDIVSLKLVSPIFNQRIERDIFSRSTLVITKLDQAPQPITILSRDWFLRVQHFGLSGAQLLYLDLIAGRGLDEERLIELGVRLGDIDAFAEMGRLLATTASPDNIEDTFVRPIIAILSRHRHFTLTNSILYMPEFMDCVMALFSYPITIADASGSLVSLENAFGVLFNRHSRSLASKLKRKRIYSAVRQHFDVHQYHPVWDEVMNSELVVKLWKMERWTLRLDRLHENEEDSESSAGTAESTSPPTLSPRASSPSLLPRYNTPRRASTDSSS